MIGAMRPLAALVVSILLLSGGFAAAPPAKVPAAWHKLVDQLGDDDEEVCETASRRLQAIGQDVLPLLRKAAKGHDDSDVRLRATVLVTAIERAADEKLRISGHAKGGIVMALSPNGKYVVSASFLRNKEYLAPIWNVETGKMVGQLKGFREPLSSLDWSRDGKLIVAASGNAITVFEAKNGQPQKTLSGHVGKVFNAKLTPDGKRIVSGGADKSIRVWDLAKGKQIAINSDNEDKVYRVAATPDGKRFVSGGKDGTLRVGDLETGKQLLKIDTPHPGWVVTAVVVAPDGKTAASCGADNGIRQWSLATGKMVREYQGHEGTAEAIAFSRDGRRLIAGVRTGEVYVWDVVSGKKLQTLQGHTGLVTCSAFLPGGRVAVTGAFDGTLRLWKIRP